MKFALPLLLLAVFQERKLPELPNTFTSKHYTIKTSTTEENARELLDYMELVFTTYLAMLKPDDPAGAEKAMNTIRLYKDNAEFIASGAPRGAGAYYSLQTKELVGYYDAMSMKPFFAHEGMHQFTDLTSKNFRDFPMWFSEGIADCIGNNDVRNKKLYMCIKTGYIARMRLPTIQEAIKTNKAYRLSELMSLSQPRFMKDAGLCYAQSWSFCHFLMTYPDLEDRDSQIPNGKFRKNMAIYYETVRAGGTTHQKAWDEAFKGIPLEALEDLWKKYVLKFEPPKVLGFNGAEITDDQCDTLKIAKDKSGIKVDKVAPEGPGGKAGLAEGDIIIGFEGRLLPRDDALNRLRAWMQDVPYGKKAKLKVKRAGADVELLVSWDAPKKE